MGFFLAKAPDGEGGGSLNQLQCPHCKSNRIRQAAPHAGDWLFRLVLKGTVRCNSCNLRFRRWFRPTYYI
ncbi:MAG: hypothetical protein DWH82_04710 [Planctomycetota bacterium]|nr:MAG: hypothetical protein DWH82_04710 [Planctomycetota bacterium]